MKNILRVVFVASFVVLLSNLAISQTAVPPPPMPAADGPSLAVTMQFIQDKMNAQGKINHTLNTHDNAKGEDWPVYNQHLCHQRDCQPRYLPHHLAQGHHEWWESGH